MPNGLLCYKVLRSLSEKTNVEIHINVISERAENIHDMPLILHEIQQTINANHSLLTLIDSFPDDAYVLTMLQTSLASGTTLPIRGTVWNTNNGWTLHAEVTMKPRD